MPYVIDGNNLLGSWGAWSHTRDPRGEVVRRVAAFCRAKHARATIVFDGAPLRSDFEAQDLGGVKIRVPAPGKDADSLIREIVDASAAPADLIVVTSDKPLYSYAKTRGARVLRAHEWNRAEREGKRRRDDGEGEKPEREGDVEGWLKTFGED